MGLPPAVSGLSTSSVIPPIIYTPGVGGNSFLSRERASPPAHVSWQYIFAAYFSSFLLISGIIVFDARHSYSGLPLIWLSINLTNLGVLSLTFEPFSFLTNACVPSVSNDVYVIWWYSSVTDSYSCLRLISDLPKAADSRLRWWIWVIDWSVIGFMSLKDESRESVMLYDPLVIFYFYYFLFITTSSEIMLSGWLSDTLIAD